MKDFNIMIETAQLAEHVSTGHMIPVEKFLRGDFSKHNYPHAEEFQYIYYNGVIKNLDGKEVSKEELQKKLEEIQNEE